MLISASLVPALISAPLWATQEMTKKQIYSNFSLFYKPCFMPMHKPGHCGSMVINLPQQRHTHDIKFIASPLTMLSSIGGMRAKCTAFNCNPINLTMP